MKFHRIAQLSALTAMLLVVGLAYVIPANAAIGLEAVDGAVTAGDGSAFTQAGGHPDSSSATFSLATHPDLKGHTAPVAGLDSFDVELPPGFVGNAAVTPKCISFDEIVDPMTGANHCPIASQVGEASVTLAELSGLHTYKAPVFNMVPSAGHPASFAFPVLFVPVLIDASVHPENDYRVSLKVSGINQSIPVVATTVEIWGTPADPSHDDQRKRFCFGGGTPFEGCTPGAGPSDAPRLAFVTNPTRCTAPGEGLETRTEATFYGHPGEADTLSFLSHEPPGFPLPPVEWGPEVGVSGCQDVPFLPTIDAAQSTDQTETPSGLDFQVEMPSDGLLNPDGIAESHVKKATVTLPQGVTLNPSAAEGLGTCNRAQLEAETVNSDPGEGCPNQSKIGSVDIESPLIDEHLTGSLFLGAPDDPATGTPGAENPFDSLLALYVVAKNEERGIIIKLAGKVEPDPATGRIVTTFDDLPQLPFSKFHLHFREGGRAPLVSPPACGTYSTEADFVPWSAQDPDNPTPAEIVHTTSQFLVTQGVGGGPCPSGGVPPFKPGFDAGSINNNAGSFTPFTMRLTRNDGEQDMTRFSSILPPGVLGKLAGVSKCSDQAIAAAKLKSGREEIASPSCPANSQIGRILVGAGVGSVLTYVPGKVFLGGPFGGDPLSVVVITPAVAGPFDVGTVVTREALTLNPDTAEVQVDGAASDPIPHILEGIPLKLRDLRVYVDRDKFVLNPTSCDRSAVKATLFGSFLDVLSPSDDRPVDLASRFQAANCSSLGFKPKLSIKLEGGTKRGGHPALKAVLNARPGDANIGKATVTLPKSAFLDQAHIRTICTRVQFAAKACPPGAIYGYAKAFTPLLDEPVEGPVYLRSSNHKLPDLVAALHGLVDVNIVGRIDSFKGGIRSSFESVPDAPVAKFILAMQGGKKGLVVNSRNLCAGTNKASANFVGQNGKPYDFKPVVKASCGGKAHKKHKR